MKIIMVCEFFSEPLDYQENMLARAYHKMGHDVTVIASTIQNLADYISDSDAGAGERCEETFSWGRIIRLPFQYNFMHRLKRFEPLRPIIDAIQPDLLLFHDIIPNLDEGAQYVIENPDCTMLMDYHSDYSNSGANWLSRRILHSLIRKAILNRARPHLRKILPVTPGCAEFLRDLYGVPDAEMELFPLGVDQDYANEVLAGDTREQVRARLKIPQDAFVIFTGGKLSPLKRTEDLLYAAEHVEELPIHIILVGAADPRFPDYASSIASLVKRNPLVHNVGWQDRFGVYSHMAASDIAVFPASQSVLWQQSLGMGLPLILSERSEKSRGVQSVEYLNRYDNLIVLDPKLPFSDQIASHIRNLATDRSRTEQMARGATRTAAEILDYKSLAARTLALASAPNGVQPNV